MSRSGWHQSQLDKLHESAGTIKSLTEAAHKGAYEHLSSQPVAAEVPTPQGG